MHKLLRFERCDVVPNTSNASQQWNYWHKSFKNFSDDQVKVNLFKIELNPIVYEHINELETLK